MTRAGGDPTKCFNALSEEEKKRVLSDGLGVNLLRSGLDFAMPLWWVFKNHDTDTGLRNGSAFLVDFGHGIFAVTAAHVFKNGVILLVVWAIADRPNWDQQLKACQSAVDATEIGINLKLPPPNVMTQIARAIPQEIRERLSAINHEPIEYDGRGHIRSLCRLSGKIVSQAVHPLKIIRGCRYCQSHDSRQEERRFNARRGALAMWTTHRGGGNIPTSKSQ